MNLYPFSLHIMTVVQVSCLSKVINLYHEGANRSSLAQHVALNCTGGVNLHIGREVNLCRSAAWLQIFLPGLEVGCTKETRQSGRLTPTNERIE